MDANGLRFWQLAEAAHWHGWRAAADAPPGVEYDAARRVLRLANQRPAPQLDEDIGLASSAAERAAAVRDAWGSRAWWDSAQQKLLASGAADGVAELAVPAAPMPPSDLAAGHDGVLYLARSGPVQLLDLRGRWDATTVEAEDFQAHRLAADPAGGAWALDRGRGRLARLRGRPLPKRPYAPYRPSTFRPCVDNPDPPRLQVAGDARLPAGESAIALACSPAGRVAVLSWKDGEDARLRLLDAQDRWSAPLLLKGLKHPYTLSWLDAQQIAVAATGAAEAFVYALPQTPADGGAVLLPSGDYYPMRDAARAPFVQGTTLPPHYPLAAAGATKPLLRLSLPAYARSGWAANHAQQDDAVPTLFDSGEPDCEWHRIYLEASLQPGTGLRLWLAASETPQPPAADDAGWHLHRFGHARRDDDVAGVPDAAWLPQTSELPFHPGLLACPQEPGRSGLFTVLVQRAGRRVRGLRGRYLWLRAELLGNGRQSPEIAALRAYGSRFSYRDRYLPELYRETVFEPDASDAASATPADFLDRLLGNFEGLLTPLEDRIAQSWLLSDARSTPVEALDWLASWIGLAFDSGYPPAQRRTLLQAAPYLYRLHGTAGGLRLALEIAGGGRLLRAPLTQRGATLPAPGEPAVVDAGGSAVKGLVLATRGQPGAGELLFVAGGPVSRGAVVVVENFRMRRALATILGADLADEDDPLLAGLVRSGNSYVGDTLFLGDESQKQFLALFGERVPRSGAEERAVAAFYDELAYRVTVLVRASETQAHDAGAGLDEKLLRRVARMATPAHVLLDVQPAREALLVGVAALVAVDTWLGREAAAQTVRVGSSFIGMRDLLGGAATLDPRFEAAGHAAAAPPQAVLQAPDSAEYGESFELDGGDSRAAPGRRIDRYIWTWDA